MRRMYRGSFARVSGTAFEYVHHLVTVPVSVNGIETRFVLDSGIGVTFLSSLLCEQARVVRTDMSYTGRRMSGQAVTLELARVEALTFAAFERRDEVVGVLDLELPVRARGHRRLSLARVLRRVRRSRSTIPAAVVLEDAASLAGRAERGVSVDVLVERDGPSVTVFCR